jgi:uncharacterized protein YaaQ
MKMMIVVLNDQDGDQVIKALVEDEFRVTRIASTGGFLRRGNTTLLIGTEEERVDQAMEMIRVNTKKPDQSGVGRATVFVLNVDRYHQQ